MMEYEKTSRTALSDIADPSGVDFSSSRRRTEDFLEEADSLVAEVAAGGGGAF